MQTTKKTCFLCFETKSLTAFHKHSQMADGHLNKCASCTTAYVAAHRLANIDKARAYDNARSHLPHRIRLRKEVFDAWKINHPERRAANVIVGNAIRCGLLTPWPVCAVPECSAKPEAHHPDYSLPLDVVWLCSSHHKQAHALISKQEIK